MVDTLAELFPGVRINPFPAQSSFSYDTQPAISVGYAGLLRDFTDDMIARQTTSLRETGDTSPFEPRLHYWLMLRAVFDQAGDNLGQAMRAITGEGIWQCYRDSAAGFYMQMGLGPEGEIQASEDQQPGGCLGCFWNRETVTDKRQVWDRSMTPGAVTQYLQIGKTALAAESTHPCPGCAFPRLVGHLISTETGMHPELLPYYFKRREETLGF